MGHLTKGPAHMTQPMCCLQDACFVRFLGHVTGRAGLAQLAGTFVADPRRNFTVNQSVRAQVVQVISCPHTISLPPCHCLSIAIAHNCWKRLAILTLLMSTIGS